MKVIYSILTFFAFTSVAFSQPRNLPSYSMTEDQPIGNIPYHFVEALGLVELSEIPQEMGEEQLNAQGRKNYILPPIGGSKVVIDGKEIRQDSWGYLDKIFSQKTYAYVPVEKKIEQHEDFAGRPVWDYPVGTVVAHAIWVRSKPRRFYELRLIWKSSNGKWVLGTYSPKDVGAAQSEAREFLFLNKYEKNEEIDWGSVRLPHWFTDRSQLKMGRINRNPVSCKGCHYAGSPSSYQYEVMDEAGARPQTEEEAKSIDKKLSIENTGPCGFAPNNPYVKSQWAKDYEKKYGVYPLGW